MRLAAELATAAVAAAAHRTAVLEQERQALAKLRNQLAQELASGEDEAALAAREAALHHEIATLEAEVVQTQDEARGRCEQLHAALIRTATELCERIARREEETAETRLAARLLSALEAFGFEHGEAVPAEILVRLPRLVLQADLTRSELTEHCRQLARRLVEEGDRIAAWRDRVAEETTLRSREQELLAHLRLHGRAEGGVPPLVASLNGADLRTLRLLRQRVLEPILSDLAAEDTHGLPTNGDDPLSELTARLRGPAMTLAGLKTTDVQADRPFVGEPGSSQPRTPPPPGAAATANSPLSQAFCRLAEARYRPVEDHRPDRRSPGSTENAPALSSHS